MDIKNRIEDLKQRIRKHDYQYYALSQPQISDKEYDDLMRALIGLEKQYPQYKSDDSPAVRVGAGVLEGLKTVKHKQKMLSLDNTYIFEELKDWDERVLKGLGGGTRIEYVVELKIDGLSANITYKSGKLAMGATRGDGETGEDVTQNIKTIRSIPLVMFGNDFPDFIEIRGEVYLDKQEFSAMNKDRQKDGEVIFANPRNAASGSLKLLDSRIFAKRKLNFFAHSLGEYKGVEFKTQWDFFAQLKKWGMRVNPNTKLCSNFDEVIKYCKSWQENREKLEYEIDGIVVKVNDISQQKRLGFTHKSPRWAVAYKFPARQATTEVIKINVNVGRTGVITPAAELKPVECGGVVIKHATLHNFDEIRRLNVKVGDRVLIERAGDVIPKIVKVVESRGKHEFMIPKICPVCSGKIVKEKEADVAYRCINPFCPAQLERSLLHFAGRGAMDIEGMGEAMVHQLVELKLVKNFAEIYRLDELDLKRLELFKEKKINNLLLAIQKSKTQPLSRLVFALGIRHIGEKAAYVLARHFKHIDNLAKAKLEDLYAIHEVGPVLAESITDYFSQDETRKLINDFKKEGINLKEESSGVGKSILNGKNIVFTGELKEYSRSQVQDLARQLGAVVSSSVSKSTDLVVIGENPGSKYEKAKKIGVKIIDETSFLRLLVAKKEMLK